MPGAIIVVLGSVGSVHRPKGFSHRCDVGESSVIVGDPLTVLPKLLPNKLEEGYQGVPVRFASTAIIPRKNENFGAL